MARYVFKKVISILSFSQYRDKLSEYYDDLVIASDYQSKVTLLDNVYSTLKAASASLCIKKSNFFYNLLLDRAVDCEDLVESTFIMESDPLFDVYDSRFSNKVVYDIDKKDIIDYLVWFTRMRLLENHQDEACDEVIDFNKLHLTNDCKLASNILKLICDTFKLECKIVKIPPAFTDVYPLYKGNGFHYFCLIIVDGVQYIVDPTYRQFFTLDSNNINRMGVLGFNGCNPGVYMLMNESRKKTALNILKKGYVIADSENLKNYFDGFCLSYRNGLFYEDKSEVLYTTPYSVEDYFDFLEEKELLFDYESIEFMGQQDKPLKNVKFRF